MKHLIVCATFFCSAIQLSADDGRLQADDGRLQVVSKEIPMINLGRVPTNPRISWRTDVGINPGIVTRHKNTILVGTATAAPTSHSLDFATLMCLSASDGTLRWKANHRRLPGRDRDTPGWPIFCKSFVADDRVFYTTNRGELVCVDLNGFSDGENDGPYVNEMITEFGEADIVWILDFNALGVAQRTAPDGGNPTCSPFVHKGRVYCITGHGRQSIDLPAKTDAPSFVCADADTGKVIWKNSLSSVDVIFSQWSSPVLSSDGSKVLFPGGDGKLYCFLTETGELVSQFDILKHRTSGRSGARKDWPFFAPTPTINGDFIFLGINQCVGRWSTQGFPIMCLRIAEESQINHIWTYEADQFSGTLGSISIAEDTAFTLTDDGRLFGFDARCGERLWQMDLLAQPCRYGEPVIVDNLIYVPTERSVYVFRAGRVAQCLLQYVCDGRIGSTPAISEGVMHVVVDRELLSVPLITLPKSE